MGDASDTSPVDRLMLHEGGKKNPKQNAYGEIIAELEQGVSTGGGGKPMLA